jgi:hypothetical protein
LGKEIAKSFIREESYKLDSIIKEASLKKNSIKESMLRRDYSFNNNSLTPKSLKDPFI